MKKRGRMDREEEEDGSWVELEWSSQNGDRWAEVDWILAGQGRETGLDWMG